MRNNEGEFELVLGNRQLLSGFFVVAMLFGVAFAMGYIVGRNSIPSPKAQAEAAAPPSAATGSQNRPQPAPPETKPAEEQPPPPVEDVAAAPGTQAAADPQPTTQPVREGPAAAAPAPSEVRPSAPPPAASLTEPEPGTYWQVTAMAQPQAEVFAKVLRDKGFRVSLTQGTKNLTRVLVGPYPDRESLGRAKSDLESSGFHPVILKKE